MKELLPYIVEQLEKSNLEHEVNHYHSGAVMIDMLIGGAPFVVQIYGDSIGISQVTEETGWFDIIPDRSFTNEDEFKSAFLSILP